jgi:hypothetical protein
MNKHFEHLSCWPMAMGKAQELAIEPLAKHKDIAIGNVNKTEEQNREDMPQMRTCRKPIHSLTLDKTMALFQSRLLSAANKF